MTVDVEAIVTAAVAAADVPEPDVGPFLANLERLVASLNDEAHLTPDGAGKAQQQLALPLRNRIEVSWWAAQHPEIAQEPIGSPIFLTGLPRSGTTYFQYLFDPEPSMRMLRHWEGERPCPPPGADPASAQRRIEEGHARAARAMSDPLHAQIAQIHLSDVEGPEECLAILDQTFANVGHLWTYRVPSYFDQCLDTIDLQAAYEHHKLVLQLLQWRSVPRRWVLKWPCHLIALDAIVAVHPDARFVMTHRDPVQALASNCSLSAMLRRATSSEVDLHEVGRQMHDMVLRYLEHLVAFDEAGGAERTAHVDYATAVARPDEVMADVFDTLGLELTSTVQGAIAAWRDENPPGKRGTHVYALEDYGLDADQVAQTYAFYIDRFSIPPEGTSR